MLRPERGERFLALKRGIAVAADQQRVRFGPFVFSGQFRQRTGGAFQEGFQQTGRPVPVVHFGAVVVRGSQ